jgi:ribulose-phosphate 3-epimerase
MTSVKIAPSLMCSDFIALGRELDLMRAASIEYLHIDIMDGRYVPNFTLGPDFCRRLSAYSSIPLDIHLMIENPDAHVQKFASFPGAVISFHPETSRHPLRTIELIKSFGARAAISIDPAVPAAQVSELLPHVSLVCVMTVNPGYAGQTLIPQTLDKVRQIAAMVAPLEHAMEIEVDGNVGWENIPKMVEAGGNVLVAGTSSLYDGTADLGHNIERMRSLIDRSRRARG